MPVELQFSATVESASGLDSRSAYVIGTKAALSAAGCYAAVKDAVCPNGEVSEEVFDRSVKALEEGDKGDMVSVVFCDQSRFSH
eukprot:1955003-Rhodomonas_salina.1